MPSVTFAALVGALMPTGHNMIIYALAAGGAVSISALIVAGLLPALCVLMPCMLAAAYLVAVKRGYPAGTFPGSNAVGRAAIAGARIADHRHHSGGNSVGRVHRNGGRGGRRNVHDPARVPGLSHDDLESLSGGGGEGGENDRRRIAADRRVGDVPVPDGALRACGFRGNLVATISTTPWIVFLVINVILFGNVHGHGGDNPDLHADLLADCNEVRHEPVQFGMLVLINCALGLNTPPVGTLQFVGCAIGGISVGAVMKTIMRSTPR